jgi:hypothetical protein
VKPDGGILVCGIRLAAIGWNSRRAFEPIVAIDNRVAILSCEPDSA